LAGKYPSYLTVDSLTSVPDGTYMVWAQAWIYDGSNEVFSGCRLTADGAEIPNTESGIQLKSGSGQLSIVTAVTLGAGSNEIDLDCTAGDATSSARLASIGLVKVDALN
jgi:hypothetical protein